MESNNKRIAKNTLMLYFRQILILLVSLYTVSVVLNTLGIEDYGIYSVVGGIVSFFSFLSGTMASATQRFFSFSLGQNDLDKLKKTFSVNLIIYFAIAFVALLLLETIGLWFVNEHLNVPIDRLDAARWIFHFSVVTFVFTIFSTPFMAIIIAHEDMHIYAYVSIVEAILKLGVVFLLVYLPWDKLELYGMLILGVTIITTLIYLIICLRKYAECQFKKFYWDYLLLKEIAVFTGWTLFGQITSVARNQAVTILLNQMYNPVVVAARAIAVNITSQINTFSNNFNTGLYPPIIKAYAVDDKKEMFSLLFNGSKITFFLMWVFALPFLLETEIILTLWLKNPPEYAVLFTRLAMIEVLINAVSLPIATAARAPGKMRVYELSLGCIQIAIFIASWLVLKWGGAAYAVFVVAIIANVVMFIVRLLIVRNLVGLALRPFFKNVVVPVTLVALVSGIPAFAVHFVVPHNILFAILTVFASVLFVCLSMFYIGIDKQMQLKTKSLILKHLNTNTNKI